MWAIIQPLKHRSSPLRGSRMTPPLVLPKPLVSKLFKLKKKPTKQYHLLFRLKLFNQSSLGMTFYKLFGNSQQDGLTNGGQ